MTPEALPSSATAGGVYLVLLILGLVVGGLIHSRVWPWTGCWRCRGTGKLRAPGGRSWRDCPRCGSSGKRARTFSGKGSDR